MWLHRVASLCVERGADMDPLQQTHHPTPPHTATAVLTLPILTTVCDSPAGTVTRYTASWRVDLATHDLVSTPWCGTMSDAPTLSPPSRRGRCAILIRCTKPAGSGPLRRVGFATQACTCVGSCTDRCSTSWRFG